MKNPRDKAVDKLETLESSFRHCPHILEVQRVLVIKNRLLEKANPEQFQPNSSVYDSPIERERTEC
jgi:hypothetical protein